MTIIVLKHITLITLAFLLSACGTTDATMRDQGHSESYVTGFHDGRHSGMKEAGNNWEHYIKDREKFASDDQYAAGWIAGEAEGQRIQQQATAVGEAVGGGYTGYRIGQEVDKANPRPDDIANDVLKNTDTTDFDKLGK